jgi:hypothetical protein
MSVEVKASTATVAKLSTCPGDSPRSEQRGEIGDGVHFPGEIGH